MACVTMRLFYFAYGSNLHPARLAARVPSARLDGIAELPGRRLRFCKRSVDGSAKCTVGPGQASDRVLGAVYRLDAGEKPLLDRAEGLGKGYDLAWQRLAVGGLSREVFSYVAAPDHVDQDLKPYHWYKQLVLAGAGYHAFPPDYIAAIEAVRSVDDPDPERRAANASLLRQCSSSLSPVRGHPPSR